MSEPLDGQILPFAGHRRGSPHAAGTLDVPRDRHDELLRKVQLCSAALTGAERLVAAAMFGPLLRQLFSRACDLLDDIDEILIELHPVRHHHAFVRAAALHRKLESIQSEIPREYRPLLAR